MKKLAAVLAVLVLAVGVLLPALPVSAADDVQSGLNVGITSGSGQSNRPLFGTKCYKPKPGHTGEFDETDRAATGCANGAKESLIMSVVNLLMYIVGVIAVVMLVIAGIAYATSSGDEAKAKKARGAIIAALIGLAVAVLAWTLTNFVLTALT